MQPLESQLPVWGNSVDCDCQDSGVVRCPGDCQSRAHNTNGRQHTGLESHTKNSHSHLKYLSQGFNVLQQVYTLTAPTIDDVFTLVGSFVF